MAREIAANWWVGYTYSVQFIDKELHASIGPHTVRLEDDVPRTDNRDDRVRTRIRILIDGKDYAAPSIVEVRPNFFDANRYWGYVALKRLTDRSSQSSALVIAQSLGFDGYRVLTV